ncbi:hypothetical protein Tco_1054592 [Tanacetum coccineum]|uniref:Uncharacterized protein n=1 Tax=Tanacetum coccineum TaxID=301880 RepID=A0ABQ5GYQ9_9ASTR
MSPSHLKNVLNTCTLTQIMDLNELGLGHFHNNFDFESTPGELGMWVVKSYDHETHTLRMGDGRRIKVSRELIHEILGVPMGENKVISLPSTTSEDKTTTDWRYTTPFTEDRIHITRVDDHVSSLTANGWPFKVGFLVVFFSILAQGNKDGTAPIFKAWSTKLLKKRESEELKSGGFGKLPILEGLEFIEPKKPKLKKKKSEVLLLGDGSMSREQELKEFKTKTSKEMKDCLNDKVSKIKALLLDTDEKLKIALNEYPEDSDLKMILGKRLGIFKELYRRDVDNVMVVLHKDNDLSEEAVKDNKVLKEKDDVPEKGNDAEKVVELGEKKNSSDKTEAVKDNKVSNEKYDVYEKGKDVEKVVELGGIKTVQLFFTNKKYLFLKKQEMNKEKDVEKVVDQNLDKPEDIEKESEFEISKKEVSKGVLAIYEDPLKDSESQTSIFDSQPEDSQPETQDSQPGMEIGVGIQEENLEPVKNYETLEEADFPSIRFEDIESLKEVSCLEIDTQKSPQIQKQGLQEESPQIQKQGIPKSFHSNKLKLTKYVSPDAQAIVEKRQEDMLTETRIFRGK